MAEEIVWNKKLLIVALVVGVAAVAMFYLYDARQQKRIAGDRIRVLSWKRDLNAGEEIAQVDIDMPPVKRSFYKQLQGVLTEDDLSLVKGGQHLARNVRRGDFIRFSDIQETGSKPPSARITPGYRAIPVPLDPNASLGDLLRVDDRVDVLGNISGDENNTGKVYLVLRNVRVLAVGGRSAPPEAEPTGRRRSGAGMRSYRSVTIEIKKENHLKWIAVEPRLQGKVWLGLRPLAGDRQVGSRVKPEPGWEINPALKWAWEGKIADVGR